MEKKIEVQVGERTVRIMPHMIADAMKFGATRQKKVIKEAPKELIKPVKFEPLPEMKIIKPAEIIPEELEEAKEIEEVKKPELLEKSKRKVKK